MRGVSSTHRKTGIWSRSSIVPALEDGERYDRLTGYFKARRADLGGAWHRGAGSQCRTHEAARRLHARSTRDRGDRAGREPARHGRPASRRHAARTGRRRGRGARTAGLDGRRRPPRSEGRRPLRRESAAHPRGWHLPREVGRDRRPRGRPDRLDRQPERDRGRLEAELGEHQRLQELGRGVGTRAGAAGAGELRSPVDRPITSCRRPRCARGRAAGPDALHARERQARPLEARRGNAGAEREAGGSRHRPARSTDTGSSGSQAPGMGVHREGALAPGRRRTRRRGDRRGHALAASDSGVRTFVLRLAAEAPDRRRGRLGQNHPGRHVAAPSVARRVGEAHPHPGAEGSVPAVADRTAGEVQPELADLRRPTPGPVSVAGAAR